ncbi:SDR family NAD(P)-dependent oxidoreductase [Variovorax saccharolyticus]|uniref:SDR family NAD(P)-dependent oxidoreductase n=1 Tax=Variovorax saccharolyticus TaxID=3053516 RepID=UPI002576D619|nr:glucose 1-dehydrogenase [Variovorax sp. J22R187]MDM0022220.1 glucose 1-dehydrogenase [Variovorax sp. J22R187]
MNAAADNSRTDDAALSWLGLEGLTCVVTGAASGIGAQTARQFAMAGAAVAVVDRDVRGARAVAAEIEASGGRAIAQMCDVSRPASIEEAGAEVINRLGPCAVLVNNAAVTGAGDLLDLDVGAWNDVLAVNLTGTLHCARVFGRQMIRRGGGSMIHVGSISGVQPQPGGGAYSVSKAGLSMLSRQLATELGEHRIRSNAVCPAMVVTPLSENLYTDPQVRKRREQLIPCGRIGTAEDIANTILFLASDRSGYLNGQIIVLDGGLSQAYHQFIPRSE